MYDKKSSYKKNHNFIKNVDKISVINWIFEGLSSNWWKTLIFSKNSKGYKNFQRLSHEIAIETHFTENLTGYSNQSDYL